MDAAARLLRYWVARPGGRRSRRRVVAAGPDPGPAHRQRRLGEIPSWSTATWRNKRPWASGATDSVPSSPCARVIWLDGRGTADDGYAAFRGRDRPAGRRRWPRPGADPHRGQRGEWQPRPVGDIEYLKEPASARPAWSSASIRAGSSYDRLWLTFVVAGETWSPRWRVDVLTEGIHSGPRRWGRPLLVPHPAADPLWRSRTRKTGRILLPELLGAGYPRLPPGQPRAAGRSEFPHSTVPAVDGLRLLGG